MGPKHMVFDGRRQPDGETLHSDVCIIGAGASGITLALEFANTPIRVLLLESGGKNFSHPTQFLYRAENVGRPYYDMEFTKQRYFGGATNKWYGRCRPLDDVDFEKRSWIPYSGWPFSRKDLDPYYERAHKVLQLGAYDYNPASWQDGLRRALPLENTGLETKIFHFSPPTRFAAEYLATLEEAENISLFLSSNAVSVSLNDHGDRVTHVNFTTLRGNTFRVKARIFILAASALESTRLLLLSNDVHENGIGNQRDLVGRFFMEHPHIFIGALVSPLEDVYSDYYKILDYDSPTGNLGIVGALGFKEEVIRRHQSLNACAFFVKRKAYKVHDTYFGRGALALTQVMDTFTHTTAPGSRFRGHLMNVLKNGKQVTHIIGQRAKEFVHPSSCIAIRTQIETSPNPHSRVLLSDKKDRLGMRRLILDWKMTQQDLTNFERFQTVLFQGLRASGFDVRPFRHETDEAGWPVTILPGKHHMGTTRMHTDPEQGVVDANSKVHDVNNLYVAGSSVFPTSGQANPMLTVVALSIRLAHHVKNLYPDTPN